MRKVVNIKGKNIYVYRKGHENKHLGRTFVRLWKEGKVNLPGLIYEFCNWILCGKWSSVLHFLVRMGGFFEVICGLVIIFDNRTIIG